MSTRAMYLEGKDVYLNVAPVSYGVITIKWSKFWMLKHFNEQQNWRLLYFWNIYRYLRTQFTKHFIKTRRP